jgi:hypothetical protein
VRYGRNLLRYSRWHALDFAIERGIVLVLIALSVIVPASIAAFHVRDADAPFMSAQEIYSLLGGQLTFLIAIMITAGMMAESRRSGTYRFVFSKPVSIPAYYAQQYVIWGLGLAAVDVLIAAAMTMTLGPVSPWGLVSSHLLGYVLLGGMTFFFSTFLRHDWMVVAALWITTHFLLYEWKPRSAVLDVILAFLPPILALDRAEAALIAGNVPALSEVALAAGYGLLFLVAGLVILDRREFAR